MGQPVPQDDLPDASQELDSFVQRASIDTGLPAHVIHKVIMHESSGNANAVSPTGPQGLMQLSKAAAKDTGISPNDRFNPAVNVEAGSKYLKQQIDEFGPKLGFAAYHDGPSVVRNAIKTGDFSKLSEGAQTYIKKFGNDVNKAVPTEDLPDFTMQQHASMEHTQTPDEVAHSKYYSEVAARGSAALARYNEVRDMGSFKKSMIAGGHELNKLAAGTNELAYNLAGMMGVNPTGMQKKVNDIADTQQSNDKVYKEFSENAGIPGVIGSSLPYIVSSSLAGPVIGKGMEALVGKFTNIPGEAIKEGKSLFTRGVQALSEQPGVAGNIGQGMKTEITAPWLRMAAAKAKQVSLPNPYRVGAAGRVLGGTALGAGESGLHYDQSMGQGALSSLLPLLSAEALRPALIKAPIYWQKPEQDLVKWYEEQGAHISTGLATGSKGMQDFESGMRNTRYLRDTVGRYDAGNDIINNRIVADAIGLKTPSGDKVVHLGPSVLRDHLKDLGNQYNELEKGTVARLLPQDHAALAKHQATLLADSDPHINAIGKSVGSYVNRIQKIDQSNLPKRNTITGRMEPKVVDGGTFQSLRSDLKSDISDAYKNGNTRKAEALKPVLDIVDNSVERGLALSSAGKVTTDGVPVGIQKWKDLNEKTALTHMVMDNGLNTTGTRVEPHRLLNQFKSGDVQRFYTESGGKNITQLHKLAKINAMDRDQSSALAGLGTHGVMNSGKQSFIQKLLQTPAAGFLPMPAEFAMWLYNKGYPSKTGLLAMSGKKFGDPGLYARALGQSQQPWPSLYDYVDKKLSSTK